MKFSTGTGIKMAKSKDRVENYHKKWDRLFKRTKMTLQECNINSLEVSPTDRARCRGCDKLIGKNTLRGKCNTKYGVFVKDKRILLPSQVYYCYDCSLKYLIRHITEINKAKKILSKARRNRKVANKKQEDLRMKEAILDKLESSL
jgi:hypothetical protein